MTDTILGQVRHGEFKKSSAEQFASFLHPEVRGKFINAQGETNFEYSYVSMKEILAHWYSKVAFKLTKEETLGLLIEALEKSEMLALAYEIRKIY